MTLGPREPGAFCSGSRFCFSNDEISSSLHFCYEPRKLESFRWRAWQPWGPWRRKPESAPKRVLPCPAHPCDHPCSHTPASFPSHAPEVGMPPLNRTPRPPGGSEPCLHVLHHGPPHPTRTGPAGTPSHTQLPCGFCRLISNLTSCPKMETHRSFEKADTSCSRLRATWSASMLSLEPKQERHCPFQPPAGSGHKLALPL